MAEKDENSSTLSDFLKARKAAKTPAPTPAPTTPEPEEPATRSRPARTPRKGPGFFRKAAGAVASEMFGSAGHLGKSFAGAIGGNNHRGSYMGSAKFDNSGGVRGSAIKLSTQGAAPAQPAIGVATDPKGIEKQVIQLDKEIRDYSRYFDTELKKVRGDLTSVSTAASNALKGVEQLKRDWASELFRKRVSEAKIRDKNGRFMSSDQLLADPSKAANTAGILPELLKEAAKYGLMGAGGLLGLRGGLKGATALARAGTSAGSGVAARNAGKLGLGRYLKGAGKGAGYLTAYEALKAMKSDSQTGNHGRSSIRDTLNSLGIGSLLTKDGRPIEDDPNEAAPWSKSEPKGDAAKADDDVNIEADKDISITTRSSMVFEAKRDITIEAKNDLSFKARHLKIDAEKLTVTVNGQDVDLASGGKGPQLSAPGGGNKRGGENLSADDQRYQDNVNKYGRDAADAIREKENRWYSPGNVLGKIFPSFSKGGGGQGRDSSTASNGQYNASGTGYQDVAAANRTGKYRPKYDLGDNDIHDDVVNTIAGEAYTNNQASMDAVIHNMFNRVGTKAYGPSGNLREVARAPGQYAGYRRASPEEAQRIRDRIKAIASGDVPDITGGANEFRASSYNGPWAQRHAQDGQSIGGNRFAYNRDSGVGRLAPYKLDDSEREAPKSSPGYAADGNLRIKGGYSGQATAGGAAHAGVMSAASRIQGALGDNLTYFSGFNDDYHHKLGYHSKHSDGLAGDFAIKDGDSAGAVARTRDVFKAAGLVEGRDYKLIDEYKNPSGAATGGHIHYQFASADAAQKFQDWHAGQPDAVAKASGESLALGPTADQGGRPNNMQGQVNLPSVGDFKATSYRAGSGGYGGDTAIPYGTYPIGAPQAAGPTVSGYSGTNAQVMPVGFGDGNRVIPDPKLGRNRTDIQIHSDNDASRLLSAGCLAIPKKDYPQFLSHVKALIARDGPMVLRVSPSAAGQPHNFEIIPASQSQGSSAQKMTPTQAVDNFTKTGDVNPAQPASESLASKLDESKWADKDAAWFKGDGGAPDTTTAAPANSNGLDMAQWKKQAEEMAVLKPAEPNVAAQSLEGANAIPSQADSSMSKMLGSGDLDKQASDADMIRAVPTPPNLSTNDDPDAGQKLTDQIANETSDPPQTPKEDKPAGVTPRTYSVSSPKHHPESEAPRPGSDGYGDQQQDPDDCGICSI